jgi:hypothetical protein
LWPTLFFYPSPSSQLNSGVQQGDAAPGEILTPKHKLGDEVYDLPNWGGHDEGDVHMPADQIKPYQFAHPSLRQVRRKTTLAGAYDDSVNYANR